MHQASATGTRTRVARVRAKYPNQLDYGGIEGCLEVEVPTRCCIHNRHFGWVHNSDQDAAGPERLPAFTQQVRLLCF